MEDPQAVRQAVSKAGHEAGREAGDAAAHNKELYATVVEPDWCANWREDLPDVASGAGAAKE